MKNEKTTVQMNHILALFLKEREVKLFGHIITHYHEVLPVSLILEAQKDKVVLSFEVNDVNISHLKHPFTVDCYVIHTSTNRGSITITEYSEYVNIHDAFKLTLTFQSMLDMMLDIVQAPPMTLDDLGLALDASKNYKAMLLDDIQKNFKNISIEDGEYVLSADTDLNDVNLELHVVLEDDGFSVYPLYYPYSSEPIAKDSTRNIIIKIEPAINTRSLSFEPMSCPYTSNTKNYQLFLETSESLIELLLRIAGCKTEKSFEELFLK